MRIIKAFTLVALCTLSGAALAQDFLQPLQDMVDELTAPPTRSKPRTDPAPQAPAMAKEEEEAAPIPRPRPPDLPDVPVVPAPMAPEEQAPPAPEDEPSSPEPEAPPEPVPDAEPEPATEPIPEAEPEPEPTGQSEPERVYQVACPAVIAGLIEAEMAPPLSEDMCGEKSPLTVTGVMSRGRMVPLSSPITTNCQLASQLPGWVESVDGYAQSMLESPLAGVTTGTSYMCRPRNSAESQFTSEHGFANAVDVVGFTLEDGRSIGVTENWMPPDAPEGRLLRLAHDAACGSFMTVLGPEANAEHHDHFHLDMGCHGKSCEARICQ